MPCWCSTRRIGQEAVNVAETFHREIGLSGLILTKLDGDARGGAALSIQHVTHCPILMTGIGERLDDLEIFHPDRMASRILGMGDIISLVEKAQAAVDVEMLAQAEETLRKKTLTLEDFLSQMQQMKKLGSMSGLLEMLPGVGQIPAEAREQAMAGSEQEMKKAEAIIRSMTRQERRHPEVLDASRKRRIARGSGTDVAGVKRSPQQFPAGAADDAEDGQASEKNAADEPGLSAFSPTLEKRTGRFSKAWKIRPVSRIILFQSISGICGISTTTKESADCR